MWIVRIALSRPYTFIVLALLILMLGPLTIMRMPTDIFPNINIPIVSVLWGYGGLSAEEMANRIVSNFERAATTTVNDIEHIESQTLRGQSVVKFFFQPNARLETAIAQLAAVSQPVLRQMPPGTQPPFIISYSAATVPILQLGLSGDGLSEQVLFDLGANFLRTQLVSVQGALIPGPYGGKQAQIQVDLDPVALRSRGLSPLDVVNAIGSQNLILPAGTSKIGSIEYDVEINGSVQRVEELNDIPIKNVGRTPITLRDVAHVRNGYPPQTNIVRVNGQRSSLLSIMKNGNASTLDIIARIKDVLPIVMTSMPPTLKVTPLSDQSIFVRASIDGVVREGVIAAVLTSLLILLLLGSLRSTFIVAVSIPLSVLSSIIVLGALGETLNIMTLGGLALSIGIIVDNGIVAIENISWNLEQGKELEQAILDGAEQITVPAFVSTLCICIVFVPMFFLAGIGRFLFVPMAEAVVFAMMASFVLSRTLLPTLARYLLKAHVPHPHGDPHGSRNPFVWFQRSFDRLFNMFRDWYRGVLEACLEHRVVVTLFVLALSIASMALVPWIGRDFFPSVDSGQFRMHVRARTGTRIEETAVITDRIEQSIRRQLPPGEVTNIIDNIGLPYSGVNLSYSNSAPIGPADADILVSLGPEHGPTAERVRQLRQTIRHEFPSVLITFMPADMVGQIMSFGLPAPIDVQIVGRNLEANQPFAEKLASKLALVPGMVDLRVHQAFDQPRLHFDVDRMMASQAGYTAREIATNLLITLSGSGQTTPTFWLNPATGVSYSVATQTPQYRMTSLQNLGSIPITGASGAKPQLLEALTAMRRGTGMAVVSHYNTQPVIDIFASVQGRDLGGVADDMTPILEQSRKTLPRGSQLVVRGQIDTMNASFRGLLAGLLLASILVYLLIVVNFQSWLDPFIIISALPSALAGIVWMLFLTGTTLSVPALTGAIMSVGVATANSILVVSFAKDEVAKGRHPIAAAIDAGFVRFRPVLMTALAMIIGMLPMALGMGEGAEQNAPLGRAVIGGLSVATLATLFFVPAVFGLLHRRTGHATS